MTDNLTAADFYKIADLIWPDGNCITNPVQYHLSQASQRFRDEAARREAVAADDYGPEPKDKNGITHEQFIAAVHAAAAKYDAPPADDLCARLREMGMGMIADDPNAYLGDEAAAALEALRARVAALEAQMSVIKAHDVTAQDLASQGPDFALRRLRNCVHIATQALAAGGGNG